MTDPRAEKPTDSLYNSICLLYHYAGEPVLCQPAAGLSQFTGLRSSHIVKDSTFHVCSRGLQG